MITLFTPVYNRARIIENLYNTICQQTFKDFEWLIVDDGSSDNISEVIGRFIAEGKIIIRFYSQKNGGKHRAINKGVSLANGELFFIVDSDDTITPDALEQLNKYYQQIKDNEKFAGVSGYRCLPGGEKVYNHPEQEILDCNNLEFGYKYNQIGGTAEAYKTSILRQYPFPDIEGEKFCAESLIWNRIAQNYSLRFFNKSIYIWNYLPDGLTSASIRNRMKSPIYAMLNYLEQLDMDIPVKRKIKCAINYWRFFYCSQRNNIPHTRKRYFFLAPVGYLVHLRDLRMTKNGF
jgi:glycosyltransferase involved in cell wall biosynthesis